MADNDAVEDIASDDDARMHCDGLETDASDMDMHIEEEDYEEALVLCSNMQTILAKMSDYLKGKIQ